jgi:hypothetical protein
MQWHPATAPGSSPSTTRSPNPLWPPPTPSTSPSVEKSELLELPTCKDSSTSPPSSPSHKSELFCPEPTWKSAKGLSGKQLFIATRTGIFSRRESGPWMPQTRVSKKRNDGPKSGDKLKQVSYFVSYIGDIDNIDPRILVPFYSGIKRIARDYQVPVADLPPGVKYAWWIHGPAGCGKTKSVADAYPLAYRKPLSKWWDGYQGQEIVVLDDVDPTSSAWLGRFLKIWGDRYSFPAESKGGSSVVRPRKFFVTSQYSIAEVFPEAVTQDAINRRFVVIEKVLGQNIII